MELITDLPDIPTEYERIRAATNFHELARAVTLGTLSEYGLNDARSRLRACNDWPRLPADLDALRIRVLDLTCRAIAAGNADMLSYYAAQGDLIGEEAVPDDLSTLGVSEP